MDASQLNIQALIAETEALNWDGNKNPFSFGLIGKILSPTAYWVRETLLQAWKFASPFEVEALPSEKFLFKLFQQSLVRHQDSVPIKGLGT